MQSKQLIKSFKQFTTAVTNYTRPDLTTKWIKRIQVKAKDAYGQDATNKLSSLVDFYSKSGNDFESSQINWEEWKKEIRTEGIVEKLKEKNAEVAKKNYNIDDLAAKSAVVSDKYDNYGLLLKYNFALWNDSFKRNMNALYGFLTLGDLSMVSTREIVSYQPGVMETYHGWLETGYLLPGKSLLLIISQFNNYLFKLCRTSISRKR